MKKVTGSEDKRLKLEDFKTKKLQPSNQQEVELLLGQVLGNCQDGVQEPDYGLPEYYD